jgi:hypothetical protein
VFDRILQQVAQQQRQHVRVRLHTHRRRHRKRDTVGRVRGHPLVDRTVKKRRQRHRLLWRLPGVEQSFQRPRLLSEAGQRPRLRPGGLDHRARLLVVDAVDRRREVALDDVEVVPEVVPEHTVQHLQPLLPGTFLGHVLEDERRADGLARRVRQQ